MGWFDDDSDDNDNDQRTKNVKNRALPSIESIMAPEGDVPYYEQATESANVNKNGENDDDPLEAYMKSLEGSDNHEERKRKREFNNDDDDEDEFDVDQKRSSSKLATGPQGKEVEDDKKRLPDAASPAQAARPFQKVFWGTTDTRCGREWRKQNDVQCSVPIDPIHTFHEMRELLGESLLDTIRGKGYQKPTLVQSQTLPVALSGHDVLVTAATGQGKTLSFIWPMVVHIVDQPHLEKNDTGPIALCLVPTRELALQVFQHAKIMLKPFGGSAKAVIGGQGKYLLYQELKKSGGVEVVVATPGRLLDVCSDGKKGLSLQRTTLVVLDEADKMLSMGFESSVRDILSSVRSDRQVLMFSATLGRRVETVAKEWLSNENYARISVGKIGQSSTNVDQNVIVLQNEHAKETFFIELLPALVQVGKTLVFVSTRERCEKLGMLIQTSLPTIKVATLHGDKHQSDRSAALRSFSRGDVFTLVSTDLGGRGLDVADISTVVCFDAAKNLDSHVHRVGRAGRLSAKTNQQTKGTAYTLLTHKNADFASVLKRAWEREGRPVSHDLQQLARESRKHGFVSRKTT
mmetsp:Transcript_23230/g.64611  ORF Transcript_23230/g.64611 Transcript_23230/m.64611 type:complete len:576 (+) Transcript_23230:32-1759(+)